MTALMVIPGILAQIGSVFMQYIDASMVGHLGSAQAASVGLVSSSIWLLCGLGICLNVGHYVQISQFVGAGQLQLARNLVRQSYLTSMAVSLFILLGACLISDRLPHMLGGDEEICADASVYFLIYCFSVPFMQVNMLSTGILQGAGSMKLPGALNILRCLLDVVFNFLLIFDTATYRAGAFELTVPGFGMGVAGAALGTVLAEFSIAVFMVLAVTKFNPRLRAAPEERFAWRWRHFSRAARLALPMGFEHCLICFAMVVSVVIVATLNSDSVAAHSFAITAESFCYMIAYGISSSASAMMGQTIGAQRRDIARRLARTVVTFGVVVVGLASVLMYVAAPGMMAILTPDQTIQNYGVTALRTVAWAEPLFAASIVASGLLRGAGDTLGPSVISCSCMWLIRLPLSFPLAWALGLYGVWVAMSIQLCITGALLLLRLKRGKWLYCTKKEELSGEGTGEGI